MYNPSKPYKDALLDKIKTTWDTPYISVQSGAYPVFLRKHSSLEVDHTDGVGTKGIYHWQKRTFRNAVIDALAMNLNDLALVQATPYKLQNHIVLPEDDHGAILDIVEHLARECRDRNIAMTGGETSIHNASEGMDISLTVSGFSEAARKNKFKTGDVLVGLASNGLHSNGFTKVRELFEEEFRPDFTEPTKIYLDQILSLGKKIYIHGMMHITGGAFTKLKDLLDKNDAIINLDHTLKPQSIFKEIYKRGVPDVDMYRTFNCGIGFIFSVSPEQVGAAIKQTGGSIIGEVAEGTGKIRISSMFSRNKVEY